MKMKTFLIICGVALIALALYGRKHQQIKQLPPHQGDNEQDSPSLLEKIFEIFKRRKISVPELKTEFVERLSLMEVVDYFKSLHLTKEKDIPFVANAKHPKIQEMLNDQSERPFALFVATYNEDTDNIENYRSIEANELDDEIKNILGDEPIVVLS